VLTVTQVQTAAGHLSREAAVQSRRTMEALGIVFLILDWGSQYLMEPNVSGSVLASPHTISAITESGATLLGPHDVCVPGWEYRDRGRCCVTLQ